MELRDDGMKITGAQQRQAEAVVMMLAEGGTLEQVEEQLSLTVWGVDGVLSSKAAKACCDAAIRVGKVQAKLLTHRFIAHAVTHLIKLLNSEDEAIRLKACDAMTKLAGLERRLRRMKAQKRGDTTPRAERLPNHAALLTAVAKVVALTEAKSTETSKDAEEVKQAGVGGNV